MIMKLEYCLTAYTKINSKQTKDLNKRTDNMKISREKSRIHFDIKRSKFFFDPPLRIMKNKTKINKRNLNPVKSTGMAGKTINTTKRQTS